MTKDTELFYEPLEILEKLSGTGPEMTRWQTAFLCGLLKSNRPKKIVEVGVAAGATSAVILNTISMLNLDAELYSVDLSESFYRDKTKETGYLAKESEKFLAHPVKHTLCIGTLPEYLERIGGDIDFLILDTAHTLPGELLDFLAAFPMLKQGCCVVLHDIILNHLADPIAGENSYATKVLLSSVAAEKVVGKGNDTPYHSANIGAFYVTEDTGKYIENVFSALTIIWQYLPTAEQLERYRKHIAKYYKKELLEEYEDAVLMNTATRHKYEERKKEILQDKRACLKQVFVFIEKMKENNNIFLYGCGFYGKRLCWLLESCGIEVTGFVVSDGRDKPELSKPIYYPSELKKGNSTIILAMDKENRKSLDLTGYIVPEDGIFAFIQQYMI